MIFFHIPVGIHITQYLSDKQRCKIQIITGLVKDHRNLFFDLLFISCILLSKNP